MDSKASTNYTVLRRQKLCMRVVYMYNLYTFQEKEREIGTLRLLCKSWLKCFNQEQIALTCTKGWIGFFSCFQVQFHFKME